jgi:hypothetical protein
MGLMSSQRPHQPAFRQDFWKPHSFDNIPSTSEKMTPSNSKNQIKISHLTIKNPLTFQTCRTGNSNFQKKHN